MDDGALGDGVVLLEDLRGEGSKTEEGGLGKEE